jgi:S-adenosylmethionine decarboxylase
MHGIEWIVEAHGCSPDRLRDVAALDAVFAHIVADMKLRAVAPTVWHRFPTNGGVTGVCVLAESHLTCHTFPEYGSACVNVFCCRPRDAWDFDRHLRRLLGAGSVSVRTITRQYTGAAAAAPSP